MATNISNLPISSSFQDLVLESGSILQNATGSVINNLTITSSFAITASHATNVPATASFAVRATSASMADSASYAVSASVEITKEVSSSYADVAEYARSVSGSGVVGAVESASFAETASFFDGSVVSSSFAESASRAVSASMADSSSYAVLADDSRDLIIGVKSSQATTILKGQVLHSIGVTGENINVVTASNDNSANMPAIAIAAEDINAGATSTAVISGKIIGINTDGLVAGANVYVDVNGRITGTKPTGSALIQNIGVVGKIDAIDGELVVLGSGRSNDLPNITSGYAWVGNENQVPIAVSTASFSAVTASYAISASIASNADSASNATNAITASHTAGTASFANFATSASVATTATTATTATSASFAEDARTADTAITASHVVTASFADNASSASVSVNATSASVATNADSASNADRAVTASIADDIKTGIDVSFRSGSFDNLTATSASIGFLQSITGSAKIIGDAFIILNNDTPTERFAGIIVQDSGSVNTSASIQWDGESHDWKYSYNVGAGHESAVVLFGPEASEITDTRYPENNYILKGTGGHHLASSSIVDNDTTVTIGNTTTFSNGASGSFSGSFEGEFLGIIASASHAESASVATNASQSLNANTAEFANEAISASIAAELQGGATASYAITGAFAQSEQDTTSNLEYGIVLKTVEETSKLKTDLTGNNTGSFNYNPSLNRLMVDNLTVRTSLDATIVSSSYATSASFAESSSFAEDARTADSALTATTASHALSIPGVITNDVEFTGVVSGDVNAISIASSTASIDYNTSNFFTLALPAGGNVHVNATNIKSGTTINLQITQNSTPATMDFADYIKFESGSEYTASTGSGDIDLISFVTFDTTNVLAAGINHLV